MLSLISAALPDQTYPQSRNIESAFPRISARTEAQAKRIRFASKAISSALEYAPKVSVQGSMRPTTREKFGVAQERENAGVKLSVNTPNARSRVAPYFLLRNCT